MNKVPHISSLLSSEKTSYNNTHRRDIAGSDITTPVR